METAQYIQDHVVHFYILHALDWVDVVSAIKANPAEASRIASPTPACRNIPPNAPPGNCVLTKMNNPVGFWVRQRSVSALSDASVTNEPAEGRA